MPGEVSILESFLLFYAVMCLQRNLQANPHQDLHALVWICCCRFPYTFTHSAEHYKHSMRIAVVLEIWCVKPWELVQVENQGSRAMVL